MATAIVATAPLSRSSEPALGNFTLDADGHLWCAEALAVLLADHASVNELSDELQEGLRFLLSNEIQRARKAAAYEARWRAGGAA